ncbi:MAG: VOC family protein [Gammaproteobacteria bacterium]|nr:VOC family protein [Gammaproteobacteria bacterium]
MSNSAPKATPGKLAVLNSINHAAYRCRDAEQTRWFYEDVLGIPLVASLIREKIAGLEEDTPYLHLFFQLGNGNLIAFFDEPTSATPEQFERAYSFDRHLAFEVGTEAEMLEWQKRINAAGVSCLGPVDHGIVRSVYMYDPNGLQTEICVRTPVYDQAMAAEQKTAHENIRKWNARTRAAKEAKFGAAAIDVRSRQAGRKKS